MSKINWREQIGWTEENLEDLRFAGYAYLRQGKYDIAIAFFQALTVLDTKNAYDARTLGALYLQTGEALKSIEWFEHSLQLERNHAATLLNLCKALFTIGKKAEGLKLAAVLKKEPNKDISNTASALIMAYS